MSIDKFEWSFEKTRKLERLLADNYKAGVKAKGLPFVAYKVFLISYSRWAGEVETLTWNGIVSLNKAQFQSCQAGSDTSKALFGKEWKLDLWDGDIS